MENYCGKQLSMEHLPTYQMELELNVDEWFWLKNGGMHTCEITLAAWNSIYPKIMIHFDDLNLDCKKGHLEFYDGPTNKTRVTGKCGQN